jgi:tetratricopeptide (TPR) repeat protein
MSQEEKPKTGVEIKDSKGVVVGDYATIIFNNIGWTGFIIIFLTMISVGVALYLGLRQKQKSVMTGEFRIAIASFVEDGQNLPDKIGYTIADGINLRLVDDLHEITVGPKVEIWGPDKVSTVKGNTVQERAQNAEQLAKQIHAHMVIYGVVEETASGMMVLPEFYLDTDGFHEGSEVIGQYELGSPFTLPGANNPAWQFDFDRQIQTRSDIISSLAVGLSYFAVHQYESALETLQKVETIEGWQDDQGKEVIYALMGFAAAKVGEYDLTRSALEQAIAINPDYARPYIGMANLSYILALELFEESKNIEDVDQTLLNQCFEYLEKAVQAPEKPPLAEVETKIHFSRGQCYWLRTYTGKLTDFRLAISEFEQVIAAYDNGGNPRIRELAAESYARLGLIHRLMNNLPEAVGNYQKAAELLPDMPDRQKLYQERADEIQQIITQPKH